MEQNNNADYKEQEREQLIELGSDITNGKDGRIYTLTIIGQVEGHQVLPETAKTTKYEHVLPLLAGIEESDEIDGLLLLLNLSLYGFLGKPQLALPLPFTPVSSSQSRVLPPSEII